MGLKDRGKRKKDRSSLKHQQGKIQQNIEMHRVENPITKNLHISKEKKKGKLKEKRLKYNDDEEQHSSGR